MKITITQFDEGFMADCTDLPGSPPVGHGPTPEAAIIELFFRLMFSKINGPAEDQSWLKYLKYEHGYTMNCPNYRPLVAKKEIPGSVASLPALITRAADEIVERTNEQVSIGLSKRNQPLRGRDQICDDTVEEGGQRCFQPDAVRSG